MRSIKSSGTKPELYFEKEILTVDGYTKQCKIAFNSDFAYEPQMIAIFVDGTFWHGKDFDYENSKLNDHWKNHIQGKIDRDSKNRKYLSNSKNLSPGLLMSAAYDTADPNVFEKGKRKV